MSKKICFGSQKGGVGKTTLLYQVAIALLQKDYKVILINHDFQGGIDLLYHYRTEANQKKAISELEENLTSISISEFMDKFKYYDSLDDNHIILIDTIGNIELGAAALIDMVDFVVSPIFDKELDLITMIDIRDVMTEFKKPVEKMLFVFNQVFKTSRTDVDKKLSGARAFIMDMFDNKAIILQTSVRRSKYYEVNDNGLAALDYKLKRAIPVQEEIRLLTEEILNQYE